jgi:hypothetical protein
MGSQPVLPGTLVCCPTNTSPFSGSGRDVRPGARAQDRPSPMQVGATPAHASADPPDGSPTHGTMQRCVSWQGLVVPGGTRLALTRLRGSEW